MRMTKPTSAVLDALLECDRYGFDIMDRTGLKSGTLYPILGRLERAGWIVGEWEKTPEDLGRPRRKYYRMTAQGIKSVTE